MALLVVVVVLTHLVVEEVEWSPEMILACELRLSLVELRSWRCRSLGCVSVS